MNGAALGKQSFCGVITLRLGEILVCAETEAAHVFIFCFFFFSLWFFFSSLFSSAGEWLKYPEVLTC